MRNHPTVRIPCPVHNGEPIDIDAELAPLNRQLWRLEIHTYQCCEESRPGLAEIEFPGTAEAGEFLEAVRQRYLVHLEQREDGDEDRPAVSLRLLVYFPTADIERLTRVLAGFERSDDGDLVPVNGEARQ